MTTLGRARQSVGGGGLTIKTETFLKREAGPGISHAGIV